jgi:homoserine dehydrogenase
LAQEITFGLVGFGATGRGFLRLLATKKRELLSSRGLTFRLTGIATGSHGFAIDRRGIDFRRALGRVEAGRSISELHRGRPVTDTFDFIRRRPARVLFEITPLNPSSGQPALDHIRTALENGMHVVTANKGPLAIAYTKLRNLARAKKRAFRFEGTVMDGVPIFNMVESALPGSRVLSFYGILNSTSNLILTEMEKGRSFDTALEKAQELGIAEADPSYDIDGWDAAAKTAVLANVLMDGNIRPAGVKRKGIRAVTTNNLEEAHRKGKVLRSIARASRKGRKLEARVAPENIPNDHPMAHVTGTSSALAIRTDTMKELILTEIDPAVEQTAYALLSDLLTITSNYS